MHSLKELLQVDVVGAAIAAGATIDQNSTIIDMAGYESVLFIVPVIASVATGVATMKVEQHTLNQDSGMTAISGAEASATCASTNDLAGKLLMVEVRQPANQFVQAVVTSLTANITYGQTIAIKRPYRAPADNSAAAAAAYVSP